MSEIKVVIPPCITSRKAFNFGQSINFIYADVISKFHRIKGDHVEFTPYSWNNHARRTESLRPNILDYSGYKKFSEELYQYMEEELRKIGILHSDGRYLDTDPTQQLKTIESLEKLVNKGFINVEGNDLVLDVPRIINNTDILKYIENTNFVPEQYKKMIKNNTSKSSPFVLTQEAIFATPLPEKLTRLLPNSRKIKPIFNLIFSPTFQTEWTATYLVQGRCSARYIYDGFLINAALYDLPFCKNVHTYPFVSFEPEEGEINNLIEQWKDGNIIRFAALQYVNRNQDTQIDKNHFYAGRRLINKINNLKKFFHIEGVRSNEKITLIEKVEFLLNTGNVRGALHQFEQETFRISKDIDLYREQGVLEDRMEDLKERSQNLLHTAGTFFTNI